MDEWKVKEIKRVFGKPLTFSHKTLQDTVHEIKK